MVTLLTSKIFHTILLFNTDSNYSALHCEYTPLLPPLCYHCGASNYRYNPIRVGLSVVMYGRKIVVLRVLNEVGTLSKSKRFIINE